MRNPHSPTRPWLDSVVANAGYGSDPDEGDSGEITVVRDGREYRVTVTVTADGTGEQESAEQQQE